MMIANNPVENPKDAKYVPVKISAKDTPAPNQIRPLFNMEVPFLVPLIVPSPSILAVDGERVVHGTAAPA